MKKNLLIGLFLFISLIFIWDTFMWIESYFHDLKMKNDGYIFKSRIDDFPISDNDSQEKLAEDFYAHIDEIVGEGINIQEIPKSDLNETKLIKDKYKQITYIDNNEIERKVIFDKSWIGYLKFSPSKKKLGFHYEHMDVPTSGRDVSVMIMDIASGDLKEIYKGSFRTSSWEWFSENEVLVSYNCGTECQLLYLINVDSGEQRKLYYGVKYEWSPNKKMVVAYHYYNGGYGITVGDKYGNSLFTLRRERSPEYNDLEIKTQAIWSSDSSKIALYIKKETEDKMELLVFDVDDSFKQIFQSNVNSTTGFIEKENLGAKLQNSFDNNEELIDPDCMTSEGYMGEEFCRRYKEWAGWE